MVHIENIGNPKPFVLQHLLLKISLSTLNLCALSSYVVNGLVQIKSTVYLCPRSLI